MATDGRKRAPSSGGELQTINSRRPVKDNFRIVVMGATAVGKTCIVSRLLRDEFIAKYKATVEEIHRKEFQWNGKRIVLDVLDTSGTYPFPAMRRLSIATGDAFILVYSVDDESSFHEVKSLRQQIIEEKDDSGTPIVVVGNKIDLSDKPRAIHPTIAETTASIDWENGYVEVSAKDNTNIKRIFQELLAQGQERFALQEESPENKRRESWPDSSREKAKRLLKNNCILS